jgi:hypothetical protein
MRNLNYADRSERLRLGGSVPCSVNLTGQYYQALNHIQDVLRENKILATRVEIVEMALDAFFILMSMPKPPELPFRVEGPRPNRSLRVRFRKRAPSRAVNSDPIAEAA